MEQQIIKTPRCILRPTTKDDAAWLLKLFNDQDVVAYIEGIKWFNEDKDSVIGFIESMEINTKKDMGMSWSIMYNDVPVGIIMVNDLQDNPFLTFALFPEYRNMGLGTEVYNNVVKFVKGVSSAPRIETENPIVKKIIRHSSEILFINGLYFNSLVDFKNYITYLDFKKKNDLSLIDDVLALFRDGILQKWLYYLSENGDEEAFNIANSIMNISKEDGDRSIFRNLLRVFGGGQTQLQKGDIGSHIRLSQTATLENEHYKRTTVNLYRPINVADEFGSDFDVILSFEILKSRNDVVEVEFNGTTQTVNLGDKRKTVDLSFPLELEDAVEAHYDLTLDGEKFHTIVFQSYPPQKWDRERCTIEGVRHLYQQQYQKARLCFNVCESAVNMFWLGIMSYIGCDGCVDPVKAFDYFRRASEMNASGWSCIADCFRALMLMKGEGMLANLSQANEIVSNHNNTDKGLSLIKKGILGDLTGEEFDKYLYAYDVSELDLVPCMYIEFVGSSIQPFYILDVHKPFKIIVTPDLSNELTRINPQTDSLHAHIGVNTKYGDWQYTIPDDWFKETLSNTFVYNHEYKRWELEITDLYNMYNIPRHEKIFKINIVLRNASREIEIRPSKDTCYTIDCYNNFSHVVLCNLTPLLFKFNCVSTIFHQIGIKDNVITDVLTPEILDNFSTISRSVNRGVRDCSWTILKRLFT